MPLQVSISWQPPLPELSNGEITGYHINCGSSVVTTDQLNVLADATMPATIHNCLVAAATRVGPGANGSVQTLTGTILILLAKYLTVTIVFIL